MSDKTELVQLALSVNEGTRGDVVAVTPERAQELFAARAATPPRARATWNPLAAESPAEDQGRLDWGLGDTSTSTASTVRTASTVGDDPEDDEIDPEGDDTED